MKLYHPMFNEMTQMQVPQFGNIVIRLNRCNSTYNYAPQQSVKVSYSLLCFHHSQRPLTHFEGISISIRFVAKTIGL